MTPEEAACKSDKLPLLLPFNVWLWLQGYLDLSNSMWKCPFLCHPSGRLHTPRSPSWKSVGENRSVRFRSKSSAEQEYDLYSSEKASFFSLLLRVCCRKHRYDTIAKKPTDRHQLTTINWKGILRQNGKTRSGRWAVTTTDNCSQLLVFSRLGCRHTLLCLQGSRAEMGHMWHHVYTC